jgi:hypothetical protein
MIAVILEIVLRYLSMLSFNRVLFISLTVTIIAYLIGDLIILSVSNNIIATIVDIALAVITIYMFNYISGFGRISLSDSFWSALLIGIGEWFFHKYVAKSVFPEHNKTT